MNFTSGIFSSKNTRFYIIKTLKVNVIWPMHRFRRGHELKILSTLNVFFFSVFLFATSQVAHVIIHVLDDYLPATQTKHLSMKTEHFVDKTVLTSIKILSVRCCSKCFEVSKYDLQNWCVVNGPLNCAANVFQWMVRSMFSSSTLGLWQLLTFYMDKIKKISRLRWKELL